MLAVRLQRPLPSILSGQLAVPPILRASCFNRRVCLRWPLGNRLGLVLPFLFAINLMSLFFCETWEAAVAPLTYHEQSLPGSLD
jgi:hypothetical protein